MNAMATGCAAYSAHSAYSVSEDVSVNRLHNQVDVWLGKQVVKVSFHVLTPAAKFVGKHNVLLTRVFTRSEAIAVMQQLEAKVPKLPSLSKLLREALKKRGLVPDSAEGAQQAPKRARQDMKHKHLLL
jgi:hypothetical protein